MPLDDQKERNKALDIAVGQIEKQFGKGSIMRLGQRGEIAAVECIPTGAISIDYALGIGGMPRGRVVEVYGPESSGKTTLALQVIAEAEGWRYGGVCGRRACPRRQVPADLGSTSKTCSCLSLTTESRRSRSWRS